MMLFWGCMLGMTLLGLAALGFTLWLLRLVNRRATAGPWQDPSAYVPGSMHKLRRLG